MKVNIEYNGIKYTADPAKPADISIPLQSGGKNPNAFGIQAPLFEPLKAGVFVGSVALGGSVNCENLFLNAHGNGTHTECVGHIAAEKITINSCLKTFHFTCLLVSIPLTETGSDRIITKTDALHVLPEKLPEALVIRSLPNTEEKLQKQYSGNNPAYLEADLCLWLRENGVKHLLIDLPSVDREEDEGALAAHHAFWNYPAAPVKDATITEMVFVPDYIADGLYLLNLQIASFESDASPSKPVLYKLEQI